MDKNKEAASKLWKGASDRRERLRATCSVEEAEWEAERCKWTLRMVLNWTEDDQDLREVKDVVG